MKQSNVVFSMECSIAEFLQFCSKADKILLFGGRLTTFLSIPSISWISLKFPNFPRSQALNSSATREVTSSFGDNTVM